MSAVTRDLPCLALLASPAARGGAACRTPLVGIFLAAIAVVFVAGCDAPGPEPAGGGAAEEHDHDDHADHDDHDGHDHADHDHEGHDHAAEGHADDEHEHPETMTEAVEMLKGMVAKVKSSLGGDDASEADGHVHSVGHLLVDMEAKAEDLEDDVRGAVSDLIDAFGELDEKIHDEADPVFDDISDRVEAALATLDAHVEQLKKAASDAVSDEAPGDGEANDATEGTADGN